MILGLLIAFCSNPIFCVQQNWQTIFTLIKLFLPMMSVISHQCISGMLMFFLSSTQTLQMLDANCFTYGKVLYINVLGCF